MDLVAQVADRHQWKFYPEMGDFSIRCCDDYGENDVSAAGHGPDEVDSVDVIVAGCSLDWRMLCHTAMVRPFQNNFPQIKIIHSSRFSNFLTECFHNSFIFSLPRDRNGHCEMNFSCSSENVHYAAKRVSMAFNTDKRNCIFFISNSTLRVKSSAENLISFFGKCE